MRIYISGPITNDPDYKSKFKRVQLYFEREGDKVTNPAELNRVMPDATHHEYMEICLKLLCNADAVFMLNNWKESCGACIEYGYARAMDKLIMEEKNFPLLQVN